MPASESERTISLSRETIHLLRELFRQSLPRTPSTTKNYLSKGLKMKLHGTTPYILMRWVGRKYLQVFHHRQVSKLWRYAPREPVDVDLKSGHIGKVSKLWRQLTRQIIVVHQAENNFQINQLQLSRCIYV